LLTIVLASAGCGNESTSSLDDQTTEPKERIPFTLTEANNISIAAILDDKHPIRVMLHTAVSSASITTETINRFSLPFEQTATVNSWGGENSARFSSGHSIHIGNSAWTELTITESTLSGQNTDGKIGYNFFHDKIVQFDFESCSLNLFTSLPSVDDYETLSIEIEHDLMFIVGSLGEGTEKIENRFLIHSGFGGAVLLDDQFVTEHRMTERLNTVGESELKDSFGNILKTKKVLLPTFALGGFALQNVPLLVFEGAIKNQKFSVIGCDLLKRFHLIIDYQNRHLYLKPNSLYESEFT